MFYFMRDKRFDTGTDEYSDLNECVDSIMKAQAFVLCFGFNKTPLYLVYF
jgi:hypothetical protein